MSEFSFRNSSVDCNFLKINGIPFPSNYVDDKVLKYTTADGLQWATGGGGNEFDSGLSVKNGNTGPGFIEFYEKSDNGSNKVTLIGPASTEDVILTLPSATDTLVGRATPDTLTLKTLTNPTINSGVLNTAISGSAFLDEDDMASNSDNKVASQKSIKAYVNNFVQGLNVKTDCVVASPSNIILANEQSIDGVSITAGNRVLVKTQSTSSENGIYTCVDGGSWTRTTDMNASTEFASSFVFITGGNTYADTGWVCTVEGNFIMDSNNVGFAQFSSAGHITPGDGLNKSGNTLSIAAAQTGITSLLATDIKIGEDDQTKIDFGDAGNISFYAGNEKQLILEDGALYPGADNIIDLGKTDNEFKDAFFDGTVTSDAFVGPLTGDVTGNVSGNAATATELASTATVAKGGTGATSLTAGGVLFGNGTSAISAVDLSTNGNIIVGGTTPAAVTGANLAGTNLTATTGNGSLILNVDDAFLKNNADDTTTGTIFINKTSFTHNTVTDVLLLRSQSSMTPSAGIGVGINMQIETAAGNIKIGARIVAVTTAVTAGVEDVDLVFYTMLNGNTATEALRIHDDGMVSVAGDLYCSNGELRTGNGSASSPSHSFNADNNTGMYRSAADTLSFTTGGTLRLSIGSGGDIVHTPSTATPDTSNDRVLIWDDTDDSYKRATFASVCFLPGTKITMADRSQKNIEDLTLSDSVLTYDIDDLSYLKNKNTITKWKRDHMNGSFSESGIRNIWINPTDSYLIINGILKITKYHIIHFKRDNQYYFSYARNLKREDELFTTNHSYEKITTIKEIKEKINVYNFEVDKDSTYFADNYLVHHMCELCSGYSNII
jgi:hypothetical protein